jgi:Raf kinase inhibitor-like YbhB/YbcL family protein
MGDLCLLIDDHFSDITAMKHTQFLKFLLLILVVAILAACSGSESQDGSPTITDTILEIQFSSTAFVEGTSIPVMHTCDGADVSPPLSWNSPPSGVRSLALIVDDPDAPGGDWVHWVIYGISPDRTNLPEGNTDTTTIGGTNDFGDTNYGGPCPPPGNAHRYFFKLYALDTALDLEAGATKIELLDAMTNHIIAQGTLMGTYQR